MSEHNSEAQAGEAEAEAEAQASEPMVGSKAVAAACGVTGKQFRAWLRRYITAKGGVVGVDTPGKGNTYQFRASKVESIVQAFRDSRTGGGASILIDFDEWVEADESDA